MSYQFFGTRGSANVRVTLPQAYRKKARWVPQIGDIFPDFSAPTTHGNLRFHEWAEGSWVYLFSHPAAFTPVCTSEMVGLSASSSAFAERNIKAISICRSDCEAQARWADEIARVFGTPITFPMISDTDGVIARICGMVHDKESTTLSMRKSLVIDPNLRLRMIMEYPMRVGRNTEEILRVFDALRISDELDVATPSDWYQGDPLLLSHSEQPETAKLRLKGRGQIHRLLPYMTVLRE